MIHFHGNLRGLGMFVAVFLVASGVCEVLHYPGEGPAMILAGPVLMAWDLGYRFAAKDGHWFAASRGGNLFYLPVWCWGALWLGLGLFYTMRPAVG